VILSDSEILLAQRRGEIVIEPFDQACLGGNSYDVHLSKYLAYYINTELDLAKEQPVNEFEIGPDGYWLEPGVLYLGSTVEYTETHRHVPYLDGRSSVGRVGLSIHVTAGRGDVGFCNHWTMELWTVQPVKVYAGMRIGQLTYHEVVGEVQARYNTKASTSYGKDARNPRPQPSRLHKSIKR
jgi:dCTP deaminase